MSRLRPHSRALITMLASVAALGSAFADQSAAPRLQMVNGDAYAGRLVECDEAGLVAWHADDAVAPYRFPLSSVSVVHFAHRQAREPDGDFCAELFGGDVLFGTLVGLSDDAVELETAALGLLRFDRRILSRLQPWGQSSGIEYLGPDGLRGWTALGPDNPWSEEAGHPVAASRGSLSLGSVEIPARASIEVELSWEKKADFSLQFGLGEAAHLMQRVVERFSGRARAKEPAQAASPPSAFEIAAWGESLVLVREQEEDADVAPIVKLARGPGRLALRLHFDQESGSVAAYDLEGQFLARVKTSAPGPQGHIGVRLVNNRGDVRLERLLIRRSGGAEPSDASHAATALALRDGSTLAAERVTFDRDQREFVVPVESEERRISADNVLSLTFSAADEAPDFELRASLRDGSRLNGSLQKVEHGRLYLSRRGFDQPMDILVEDIEMLVGLERLTAPQAGPGRMGRLETASSSSHGTLVDAAASTDESPLAWRPHASTVSSPLRADVSGRIIYRAPPPQQASHPPANRPQPRAANQNLLQRIVGAMRASPPDAARRASDPYGELLWLRAGDRIPCRLELIDDRGVTFSTPVLEATFAPHESIKAWDGRSSVRNLTTDDVKLTRLLTLPRMQRENPPSHVIESIAGDLLRGRLQSMDDATLAIDVRLETKRIPRANVARIIWLGDLGENLDGAAPGDADRERENDPADGTPMSLQVQAVCSDGVRLTFAPHRFADGALSGESALLGPCNVLIESIDQLFLGAAISEAAAELAYSSWRLQAAPDPRFTTEDGAADGTRGIAGLESALVGKPAPDFTLEYADGGAFQLSKQSGRVVVLDFWASWCGPCMQSMPALDEMAREFGDSITWIAVNMQEDRRTVASALERLGVAPQVVLDVDGAAAEKFAVTAIPQTVVIDAQGTVSHVFIGGGPSAIEQIRTAIHETLADESSSAGQ